MNDGIEPELCSLTYTSVDRAVQVLLELGQGCVMAKLDIKSAYRIVPVHPEGQAAAGYVMEGEHLHRYRIILRTALSTEVVQCSHRYASLDCRSGLR